MPSKRIPAKDALKKTRKNFKKVFVDEGNDDNFQFLNKILNDKKFRELISAFDAVQSVPLDESITTANYDIFTAIREVLDDLLPVSEINDDALELTDILTSSHMKGYVEAITNIAAREFVPEVNIVNVVKASSVHSLRSEPHGSINRQDVRDQLLSSFETKRNIVSVTDISGLLPDLTSEQPYHSHQSLSQGIYNDDNIIKDLDELSSTLNSGATLVGIPKVKGEHLGMTVGIRHLQVEEHEPPRTVIVVERVMAGSKIEQRKLLAPGDIITEVNGTMIDTPELFQNLMKQANGIVTLKVLPVPRPKKVNTQLYIRAFFAYDPNYDTLIPCKEAGLSFMPGDILQVLNQEDQFWWQARHYNEKERAGLIPTEYLEERRRAYLLNAKDPNEIKYKMFGFGVNRKKKIKVEYSVNHASEYDRSDITMYEEVTKVPGFKRPVLCLIGAEGVGRTTIMTEISKRFPDLYGIPLRDTSRQKKAGEGNERYHFVDPEIMKYEYIANNYIDYGELNGNQYGIHIKTIREVIKSGRTCLIDCSAESVKKLRTPEFMPRVIFLAAPSIDCMRAMYEYGMQTELTSKPKTDEQFHNAVDESIKLEREYRHFFDDVIVIDNMSASFEKILDKLESLETQPQWVPAKWIY